jgi:hypothetical protein
MVKVRKEEGVRDKVVDNMEDEEDDSGKAADWENDCQLPGPWVMTISGGVPRIRSTETDKPSSNFSRIKMQAISIDPCQEPTIYMLYTSVNSPQNLETTIFLK